MPLSHRINPDRFAALLDRCGLSQKELAAIIGTDVGTVSRWKTGKIRTVRSDKLTRLCEVLRTTPTELCADGPLPEAAAAGDAAPRGQVTMMLDTACRNALALIARRYGVTRQQIVEIAPLLFAIMAEQSLAERRDRLKGFHDAQDKCFDAAPPHLGRLLRGRSDEGDDAKVLEAEQLSIEQRDLFAARVSGRYANEDASNPFAAFLSERLAETKPEIKAGVTWDEGDAPRYCVGTEELKDLLGKDGDALKLIMSGEVALAEMPGDIRRAKPEARASWVKEVVALKMREGLAALEDFSKEHAAREKLEESADPKDKEECAARADRERLLFEQAFAETLKAAEDAKHDF